MVGVCLRRRVWWLVPIAIPCVLYPAVAGAQEDLGHRVPGALGLYAGAQQPVGFYVIDRFSASLGNRLYNHTGGIVPTV
jgi:hypothetical protein